MGRGQRHPDPCDFDKTGHTQWLKDETKTAVCDICDEKVSGQGNFSYICNWTKCRKRICCTCAADDSEQGAKVQDQLLHGCWCQYCPRDKPGFAKSAINPKFRHRLTAVPKQNFDDDRKAHLRAQKAKVKHSEVGNHTFDKSSSNGVAATKQSKRPRENSDIDEDDHGTSHIAIESSASSDDSDLGRPMKWSRACKWRRRTLASDLEILDLDHESQASVRPARPENFECGNSSSDADVVHMPPLKSRRGFEDGTSGCKTTAYDTTVPVDDTATEHEHIVILGAGIIGLTIAYELANRARLAGKRIDITVVEIRSGPFELASGKCAGLVTLHGMPGQLIEQKERIWQAWHDLLERAMTESQSTFDWKPNASIQIRRVLTQHPNKAVLEDHANPAVAAAMKTLLPSWFRTRYDAEALPDSNILALLNTQKFGSWLLAQCKTLGVRVMFDTEVIGTARSSGMGTRRLITIRNCTNALVQNLEYDNLVLAASLESPEILKTLFPHSAFKTDMYHRITEWCNFQSPYKVDSDQAAYVCMPSDHPRWRAGWAVVTNRAKNQFTIVADRSERVEAWRKDHRSTGQKTELHRLVDVDSNSRRFNVIDEGGMLVSMQSNHMPVIASLLNSQLGIHAASGANDEASGVYVCFGFGRYGTTVAPLVANIMARLLEGESETADAEWLFRMPETTRLTGGPQPAARKVPLGNGKVDPRSVWKIYVGHSTNGQQEFGGKGKGRATD